MIHLDSLEATRQKGKILHPMKNIVFIVLVGVLNGYSCWSEFANLARYKRDFFEKYLDLSNGCNFNTVRKMFLWMLKNDGVDYEGKNVSLRLRMQRATHDQQYLEKLLSLL